MVFAQVGEVLRLHDAVLEPVAEPDVVVYRDHAAVLVVKIVSRRFARGAALFDWCS